jgi:hypothetical protein
VIIALSVVALVVSVGTAIYAAVVSSHVSNREVTSTVIADFYAAMRDLTVLQMQEWRLAHLFEVSENYEQVVEPLREVAPDSSAPAVVELRLKERAAALTIFGLYEHTIYQLGKAEDDGDDARTEFLRDAADYLTQRLLPNPRLRYLWSKDGGNLECEFEDAARAHYEANIIAMPHSWDDTGPYGDNEA